LGTISGGELPNTVILRDFVASEQETTRLPVRSALFKQRTGGLVVRWVTTSEYPLLYVFANFFFAACRYSLRGVRIVHCTGCGSGLGRERNIGKGERDTDDTSVIFHCVHPWT
jgi:hypothetical protein